MKGLANLFLIFFSLCLYAKSGNEVKDFAKILKKDGLLKKYLEENRKFKNYSNLQKFKDKTISVPGKNTFWKYVFESWLVREEPKLAWNQNHLSLGLREILNQKLNELKINKKTHILIVNHKGKGHFSFDTHSEIFFLINKADILKNSYKKVDLSFLFTELIFQAENQDFYKSMASNSLVKKIGSRISRNLNVNSQLEKIHSSISKIYWSSTDEGRDLSTLANVYLKYKSSPNDLLSYIEYLSKKYQENPLKKKSYMSAFEKLLNRL